MISPKLIGSPPGYLGHLETHPLITQGALAQHHREKLSFLQFDDIEEVSDSLSELLSGILDKATLTLGDNRRVDLSQTMIFMTSNFGGGEITELMDRRHRVRAAEWVSSVETQRSEPMGHFGCFLESCRGAVGAR